MSSQTSTPGFGLSSPATSPQLAKSAGLIVVAGMVFATPITTLFANAYSAVPGKLDLTVSLTRIMFPFLLLVAALTVSNVATADGRPVLAANPVTGEFLVIYRPTAQSLRAQLVR
jgi:hypothetical protein